MRARNHFNEDILRSEALAVHAASLPAATPGLLVTDLNRQAVASAVGAMDAYLCDAYVDLLTGALSRARAGTAPLPDGYRTERLPAGPLLAVYNARPNWGLRMAARGLMDRDNMLQTTRIKGMFNPALEANHKLWVGLMPTYLGLARKRLTGARTLAEVMALGGNHRKKAIAAAQSAMMERIGDIVQRRHDIVHNCDRPKQAITAITPTQAKWMVADIRSFVEILDDHVQAHRSA